MKTIDTIFIIWIAILFLCFFLYCFEELSRYFKDKKISKNTNISSEAKAIEIAKNRSRTMELFRFGLDKQNYLIILINLILVSFVMWSFINTNNQNRETSLINKRSLEISENLLNIINQINEK